MSASAILIIIDGLNKSSYDPFWHKKVAKKLSKDKPMEDEQIRGYYIIYANKTRWAINIWCSCKLIWIPDNKFNKGIRISELIEREEQFGNFEFNSTWLPMRVMIRKCKWIINCHPNLKAPNWYWAFRKFIEI